MRYIEFKDCIENNKTGVYKILLSDKEKLIDEIQEISSILNKNNMMLNYEVRNNFITVTLYKSLSDLIKIVY